MDITPSRWMKTAEDSRAVGKKSFEALFDKRDPAKANESLKLFLDAYVKAVKETGEDDRFPNLTEVSKYHGLREKVYDYKKRLASDTEFFDVHERKEGRVKKTILVPRAKEFIDPSGKYTSLRFDFERGILIFPEYAEKGSKVESLTHKKRQKLIAATGILLLAVSGGIYYGANTDSSLVTQNIYLSKDVQGDFLMLEISNPSGEFVESTFTIPEGIGENVVGKGGTLSISYKNSTRVKVSTREDTLTKVYLKEIKTRIPITLTSKVLEGYKAVPKVSGIECTTTQGGNIANFEFNLASENVLIEIEVQK